MKLGALFELGGYDYAMSMYEYETEIEGNTTSIDSFKGTITYKNLNTAFNLLWGKKMDNFDIGALLMPEWYTYEYKSIYSVVSRDINPEMSSYYYEFGEELSSEKRFAVPIVVGIAMGEPDNEMAFSLGYGYQREGGYIPVNYLESETYQEINSYLEYRDEEYWKAEQKLDYSGFYVALNGRNKRRFEDYSLTYLGEIAYANKPMKYSYYDTTYEYTVYDTALMSRRIISELASQDGKGAMSHFGLGIGVGLEKHFDVFNTNTMFAIGLLPALISGKTTLTLEPGKYKMYYYRNYPDTLEYTMSSTSNETWEIVNKYGGFVFTVPVGLETRLTDRFSLRLGATQNMTLKFTNTYEETLIDEGSITIYHRTKPTELIQTTQEGEDELDSYYLKFEDKVSFSASTAYHYGLGFKVNDNVEINILNFANLTNLSNWMVGVNIKF